VSEALKRAKRRIRREVLAVRDGLPPERRAEMGRSIVDRFLSLPEVRSARSVLAFWSFGSEVPTVSLIERLSDRGVSVALPKITEGELEAVPFRPGDATRTTAFGAEEPAAGERLPPERIDVVAVPGVAFDRHGRRIGYGGGFYDRLLRRTPAARIAVAFSIQVLDDDLPAGPADLPVAAIVTESETIRFLDLNSRSTS
jgi:5-formyltetrahydrofolate cyclo-ligase